MLKLYCTISLGFGRLEKVLPSMFGPFLYILFCSFVIFMFFLDSNLLFSNLGAGNSNNLNYIYIN